MTCKLEIHTKEEAEEIGTAAENLANVRAEAARLGRARTQEAVAVAELRAELANFSQNPKQASVTMPAIAAMSASELNSMQTEVATLHKEEGQLLAQGHVVSAELSAARERHVALRRAV